MEIGSHAWPLSIVGGQGVNPSGQEQPIKNDIGSMEQSRHLESKRAQLVPIGQTLSVIQQQTSKYFILI